MLIRAAAGLAVAIAVAPACGGDGGDPRGAVPARFARDAEPVDALHVRFAAQMDDHGAHAQEGHP